MKHKLLIFSFFSLNLYNWICVVEIDYGIPKLVKYLLAVFVIYAIIIYRHTNPLKPEPGKSFYPIIVGFIIWSLILLISEGLRFNSTFYIQRILGQPYFFLPYLLPIFILYSKFDLEFLCIFFKYSFYLIIPAVLIQLFIIFSGISIYNWYEQLTRIGIFDLSSCFLLLTAHFSKKKYIFTLVLLYSFIMIFLLTQYGRRGLLIEYMLLMFFLIVFRLKSPLLYFRDRMKIYITGLLMILLFLSYGYLITSTYAFKRGFTKDAFEESRGSVYKGFFYDFNSNSDWIFGRGLEGNVLRTVPTDFSNYETLDLIENGFLTSILKGGLLYCIPLVLILLRASYLGFYRSNNDLVKALAALILIYVIIMLYHNLPVFSTKYIFLWISVSICFTPEIRNFSNEKIYQRINF